MQKSQLTDCNSFEERLKVTLLSQFVKGLQLSKVKCTASFLKKKISNGLGSDVLKQILFISREDRAAKQFQKGQMKPSVWLYFFYSELPLWLARVKLLSASAQTAQCFSDFWRAFCPAACLISSREGMSPLGLRSLARCCPPHLKCHHHHHGRAMASLWIHLTFRTHFTNM